MAYLGKGKIPPGHPFAHTQITFGAKRPPNLKPLLEQPTDADKKAEARAPSKPLPRSEQK